MRKENITSRDVLFFLALFAIVVPPVLVFFAVIRVGVAVAAAGVTVFTAYAGVVMEQWCGVG